LPAPIIGSTNSVAHQTSPSPAKAGLASAAGQRLARCPPAPYRIAPLLPRSARLLLPDCSSTSSRARSSPRPPHQPCSRALASLGPRQRHAPPVPTKPPLDLPCPAHPLQPCSKPTRAARLPSPRHPSSTRCSTPAGRATAPGVACLTAAWHQSTAPAHFLACQVPHSPPARGLLLSSPPTASSPTTRRPQHQLAPATRPAPAPRPEIAGHHTG
jgi:hypothetical protein